MIVVIIVSTSITIIYVIYKAIRKELNIRKDAKLFIDMISKLQELKNDNNRPIKYDVFLSYSSKDRPWVESNMFEFIESKGFKVCFDERDFQFGCNIPRTIENAVFHSRKTIAVLSPDYMKSGWCLDYEYVLMLIKILNKEASSDSLLIIKYRDCQLLESMKRFTCLDYTKAYDENRNIFMKLFGNIFSSLRTSDRKRFFDELLRWLGEPYARRQKDKKHRLQHLKFRSMKK